jgi:hypothetical protein
VSDQQALIIACGALAHEIVALQKLNGWGALKLQCIPASIHNTPEKIPAAVGDIITRARPRYEHIFVAFADCGTGGLLDQLLQDEGIERLSGAHCYEFYAGADNFAKMAEAEPGTFYLTDFLARHFDRLILQELGIKQHPELMQMYFGNYTKLVYLAQTQQPNLQSLARDAAKTLGLAYEYHYTGFGQLEPELKSVNEKVIQWQN